MPTDTDHGGDARLLFLRGALRLYVLHRTQRAAVYGSALALELDDYGYAVSPGTLYPLLRHMTADGLLTVETRIEAGRRRHYYAITAAGRACLARTRSALAPFAREVFPDG